MYRYIIICFSIIVSVTLVHADAPSLRKPHKHNNAVPHNVPPTVYYNGGSWSLATVRKTGFWIVTKLTISQNGLFITTTDFLNDNRTKGYTGCSDIEFFGPRGEMIFGVAARGGVNATFGKGRKKNTQSGEYNIDQVIASGITNVTITQFRCSKGWTSRLGRTIEKTFKKTVVEGIRATQLPNKWYQKAKNKIIAEAGRAIKRIGGVEANKVFQDLTRLSQFTDVRESKTVFDGLKHFVQTGDIRGLNPIVILAASEVQRSRDQLWPYGVSISEEQLRIFFPSDLHPFLRNAKVIYGDQIASISLPAAIVRHFEEREAVVLGNLIVLRDRPSLTEATSTQRKFLLVHEAYHVKQFSKLGISGFMTRYLNEELGITHKDSRGNYLEIEADIYACKSYPAANPGYLPSC